MNELLALLLGQQNQVVDPRGPAILGQLPNVPENERLSNFNTALDFLSPSAAVDFQERTTPGLGDVGSKLGLSPEELDLIIRQSTGLSLSPLQEQEGQQGLLALLPDFLNAQTRQGELGVKQAEVKVKGREADVKQQDADTKQASETRLREEFTTLDPAEKDQLFELNLKQMALTGVDMFGNQVDDSMRQNAFTLLRRGSEIPGLSAFIRGLIEEGEIESAARLLGVPEESISKSFFGPTISEGVAPLSGLRGAGAGGAEATGGDDKARLLEFILGLNPEDLQ